MKILLALFFTALGVHAATAQDHIIKGSVQGESGKLLHFAVVADSKYNNITFTDSVGDFAITAHTDSKLLFQLDGYRDTLIDAGTISQDQQISLTPTVS